MPSAFKEKDRLVQCIRFRSRIHYCTALDIPHAASGTPRKKERQRSTCGDPRHRRLRGHGYRPVTEKLDVEGSQCKARDFGLTIPPDPSFFSPSALREVVRENWGAGAKAEALATRAARRAILYCGEEMDGRVRYVCGWRLYVWSPLPFSEDHVGFHDRCERILVARLRRSHRESLDAAAAAGGSQLSFVSFAAVRRSETGRAQLE